MSSGSDAVLGGGGRCDIPFVRFEAGIMVCIFGRSGAYVLLGIVVSHGGE